MNLKLRTVLVGTGKNRLKLKSLAANLERWPGTVNENNIANF